MESQSLKDSQSSGVPFELQSVSQSSGTPSPSQSSSHSSGMPLALQSREVPFVMSSLSSTPFVLQSVKPESRSQATTSSMAASTIEPSPSSEATKRSCIVVVGVRMSAIANW